LGLDKNDEIKSQQASITPANALGISLNPLQQEFQKGADNFISKYYPSLNTDYRSQNLNSKQNATKGQLQNIVNDGKMGKFVYRAENKNVIIK